MVSSNEGTVSRWDLTTPEPELLGKFTNAGGVAAIELSPDGKTLACAGWGGTVSLWDVFAEEPKLRAVLPDCIHPIKFAPDGKTLAGYRNEKETTALVLWDLTAAEPRERMVLKDTMFDNGEKLAQPWINSLAWAPTVKPSPLIFFATRWERGPQLRCRVGEGKPKVREIIAAENQDNWMMVRAFTPDGKTLVGSSGGDVILWDVAKAKRLRVLAPPGLPGAHGVLCPRYGYPQ